MLIVMWDEFEAAKLIDSYWKIERNKQLRPYEIGRLSRMFRKYGVDRGYPVDEKYRNENGIKLQLETIRGIYSANKKGVQNGSKLFRQMVQLYETDREAFDKILKKANKAFGEIVEHVPTENLPKTGVQPKTEKNPEGEKRPEPEPIPEPIDPVLEQTVREFSAFLKGRGYFYAKQDLLRQMDILSRFCGLNEGFLRVTDLSVLSTARRKLDSAGFVSRYGTKQVATLRDLADLYRTFVEEKHPTRKQPETGEKPEKGPEKEPEQQHSPLKTGELEAFAAWMEQKQKSNAKTTELYCSILKECAELIVESGLNLPLLQATSEEVRETMNALHGRRDFEDLNRKTGNRCSAVLARYARFREDACRPPKLEPADANRNPDTRPGNQGPPEQPVVEAVSSDGKPQQSTEMVEGTVSSETPAKTEKEIETSGTALVSPATVHSDDVPEAAEQVEKPASEHSEEVSATDDQTEQHAVEHAIGEESVEESPMNVPASDAEEPGVKTESEKPVASSWESYEQVLRIGFSNGFLKNSGIDTRKLRRVWKQHFGEVLEDPDSAIYAQLSAHCVDSGKRWYLEEHLLTTDDLDMVCRHINTVFSSGKNEIFYSSLYHAVEREISNHILTEKLLTKCLQSVCKDRYSFTQEYIAKDSNVVVDVAAEIRAVLVSAGKAIPVDKIKAELCHMPPDLIDQTLYYNDEFINDSVNGYILESCVDFTEEDLNHIADVIQKALEEDGFLIAASLRKRLDEVYPEITGSLDYLSDLGFRRIVARKLRDRFFFGLTVITPFGSAMDMTDIFGLFCRRRKTFSLGELEDLIQESGASTIYWEVIHKNSNRVSVNQFVSLETIHWDTEHADAAIELFCTGDYIALKDVYDYNSFPYVGYQWNIYMLEQYVATVSKTFTLMHSTYLKYGACGAIVRKNAGFATFEDVLADALAKTNLALDQDKNDCLDYLQKQGFIAKRKLSKLDDILYKAKILRLEGK